MGQIADMDLSQNSSIEQWIRDLKAMAGELNPFLGIMPGVTFSFDKCQYFSAGITLKITIIIIICLFVILLLKYIITALRFSSFSKKLKKYEELTPQLRNKLLRRLKGYLMESRLVKYAYKSFDIELEKIGIKLSEDDKGRLLELVKDMLFEPVITFRERMQRVKIDRRTLSYIY